jgi:hypothetical protein
MKDLANAAESIDQDFLSHMEVGTLDHVEYHLENV